ncbi:MAG: hypothetical protein GXO42_02120 [bacterium]|nr:hypothetical protein [bacterium]
MHIDKALVIGGTGVQGKRWVNNIREVFGINPFSYGRNYYLIKEQVKDRYFDLIIVSVPYHAFYSVACALRDLKIRCRYCILEKPAADNYKTYMDVLNVLREHVTDNIYVFLPTRLMVEEAGNFEPQLLVWSVPLPEPATIEGKSFKVPVNKRIREIDANIVRDLAWHPLALLPRNKLAIKKYVVLETINRGIPVSCKLELVNGCTIVLSRKAGRRQEICFDAAETKCLQLTKLLKHVNWMKIVLEAIKTDNQEVLGELDAYDLPKKIWRAIDKIVLEIDAQIENAVLLH